MSTQTKQAQNLASAIQALVAAKRDNKSNNVIASHKTDIETVHDFIKSCALSTENLGGGLQVMVVVTFTSAEAAKAMRGPLSSAFMSSTKHQRLGKSPVITQKDKELIIEFQLD